MLRLVLFLIAIALAATGMSWLADRPGSLLLNWQGYEVETSVFRAIVMLTLLIGLSILSWSLLRQLWAMPAKLGNMVSRRRHRRGLDALSSGMIAIGAGDRNLATRYAIQARRTLPDEPLTHILRAQAAQLAGDRVTSRRIFEAMLGAPETELLGLRGLFLEAEREGESEAARQFAERAMAINPALAWPVDALFELQCKAADWSGALETLGVARKHRHIERPVADRRRAVLLTAQAQTAEESDPNRALALALEANGLAPDLVPAAAIAGRILAARGNTAKAAKVIQRTWKRTPHPDLATAYAYARLGDSPRDRLARAQQLASLSPHSIESPLAVATAAIEAHDWHSARAALAPLLDGRLTQRVATLMARIESGEHGDKGRVREWLARAVNASRDPAWTADGIVAENWAPVSPVTGALDAFQWRVPVEPLGDRDEALMARKLEELVALGSRTEQAIEVHAQPKLAPAAREVAEDAEDIEPEQPTEIATPITIEPAPHRPVVTAPAAAAGPKNGSHQPPAGAVVKPAIALAGGTATASSLQAEPAMTRAEPRGATRASEPRGLARPTVSDDPVLDSLEPVRAAPSSFAASAKGGQAVSG